MMVGALVPTVRAQIPRDIHIPEFEPWEPPFGWSITNLALQRNVLVVVVDDVGVDQVPKYVEYYATNSVVGDEIATGSVVTPTSLPTVDRLAGAGVTFLSAWSSPTCSPTRAGLYSGRGSFRHGVYSPLAPELPSGTATIAQVMGAEGYATGLFGKWHLGETSTDPLGRPHEFGWDQHAGILGGALPSYYDWERVENGVGAWTTNYATIVTQEDALAWITAQTGRWMATVAFSAPHWASGTNAYEAPPTGCAYTNRTVTQRQTYRSMLECADHHLADLLAGIDPAVLEKTTIVFMGDNGTDSGITRHFASGHAKGSLYEGGVNVPLIVADGYAYLHGVQSPFIGAGRVIAPGRFETAPVQTMDVFATVAEIGLADATCGADSVSLVPYLRSATPSPQRTAIMAETLDAASGQWDLAVRGPNYKLIVRDYDGTPSYELYDLVNDRWEATDLLVGGTSLVEAIVRDVLLGYLDDLLAVPDACP